MSDALSRAFAGDIEVRSDGTGRTIEGIFVPWERAARVSDGGPSYDEMFQRGALSKTIAERGDRVKFLAQHMSRQNPLGRAIELREDAAGAFGRFQVSKTQAGDEALELVRDGALDSFSVGFTPVKHEKRGGVVVRTEVRLNEVSLVTFPAYEDARVLAVREALAAFGEEDTEELRRMVAEALHLTPATTADGQSERTHDNDGEPAGATPDALTRFRHLRHMARERGII
jgi:HK97 family phage prohead protease